MAAYIIAKTIFDLFSFYR